MRSKRQLLLRLTVRDRDGGRARVGGRGRGRGWGRVRVRGLQSCDDFITQRVTIGLVFRFTLGVIIL